MTRSQRPVWLGEDNRQWDHVRVHLALLHDGRLDAYDLAVYLGLAAHAETNSGEAYPAQETLAQYGAMSVRKAGQCIAKLAELGYIAVEKREGHSSLFRLLAPPAPHPVQGSETASSAPHAEEARTACGGSSAPGAEELEPVNESQEREGAALGWEPPAVVAKSGLLDAAVELAQLMAAQLSDRGHATSEKGTTKRWVLDMEALLRIDERTPQHVRTVLGWLDKGDDDVAGFWRTVVLSPANLRAKWTQMAEQYTRKVKSASRTRQPLSDDARRLLADQYATANGNGAEDPRAGAGRGLPSGGRGRP